MALVAFMEEGAAPEYEVNVEVAAMNANINKRHMIQSRWFRGSDKRQSCIGR